MLQYCPNCVSLPRALGTQFALYLACLIVLALAQTCAGDDYPIEAVDVFIGTGSHGHTFPHATTPFGMVAPGPDCATMGWDAAAGYHYDAPTILGFSQTHLSGTGLIALGDFLFQPTVGKLQLEPGTEDKPETGYRSRYSHDDETAYPGYYQVRLKDYDINVELTATERVAFHKYTFPQSNSAHVVLDLEHVIAGNPGAVRLAYLRVDPDQTITGYRVNSSFWTSARHQYFAAKFSKPFKSHVIHDAHRKLDFPDIPERSSSRLKAAFDFDTEKGEAVYLKVAVSPVSMKNACENLEAEVPHWDFELTRQRAERLWENELRRIDINGTERRKKIFSAAYYHNLIHPSLHMDVNGQYRGIDKEIHQADGFENYTVFSLWDTYRGTHPLLTIMQMKRTGDIVQSMLAHQKQSPYGMLPSWTAWHNENFCMIGYHAVPVIVDAFLKGLTTATAEEILAAAVSTASFPGHEKVTSKNYPLYYGQKHYLKMGYHPNDRVLSGVSCTLEHSFDDWCIGKLATTADEPNIAAEFLKRGQNYKNVYDSDSGFFRAKLLNGEFREPFDPRALHRENPGDRDYIEGNAWQWLWAAQHDPQGLIELAGGRDAFAQKLDTLFTLPEIENQTHVGDVSGLIGEYAHGNEPCHHVAYLYAFVGQPWKTAEQIHFIDQEFYKAAPDGYIGNEDCGQMSAWYVFSAMGFYPVNPCGGVYIIGTPLLEEVTLSLENGKSFRITATNMTKDNIYIQSVKLNGQSYDKVWLLHADIVGGGTLEYELGPEPSTWGTRDLEIPYSSGTTN